MMWAEITISTNVIETFPIPSKFGGCAAAIYSKIFLTEGVSGRYIQGATFFAVIFIATVFQSFKLILDYLFYRKVGWDSYEKPQHGGMLLNEAFSSEHPANRMNGMSQIVNRLIFVFIGGWMSWVGWNGLCSQAHVISGTL